MLSKIKKWFRKKILKVGDKPISKGYAECCVKCGATFKEGDNFIGAYCENFVDLDLFGQIQQMFSSFMNTLFHLKSQKPRSQMVFAMTASINL